MAKKPKPRTANPGALRQLLDAHKYESRLLGRIQEHMISRPEGDREQLMLHGSEVVKKDWCPRQSYYRLTKHPERKDISKSFVLENIFDEGNEVHAKWQQRINEMGMLRGRWFCFSCELTFNATSPKECERCGSAHLQYREVPLVSEKHMLIGHADGDVAEGNEDIAEDPLIEIKTIGIGTLRFEAPGLLADHTHKVTITDGSERTLVDLDKLWDSIKRPLPTHLRQGMLYCYLSGRTTMIFVYECKWNQRMKEFVVRYQPEVIEDILEECLDLVYDLKRGRTPGRPVWADVECKACKACPFTDTCYGTPPGDVDDNESGRGAGSRGRTAPGSDGEGADPSASEAKVRSAEAPTAHRRVARRRADEAVRGADEVDGLLRRGTGSSGGRRTIRRVRPAEG
jgi:hypothetical protein